MRNVRIKAIFRTTYPDWNVSAIPISIVCKNKLKSLSHKLHCGVQGDMSKVAKMCRQNDKDCGSSLPKHYLACSSYL